MKRSAFGGIGSTMVAMSNALSTFIENGYGVVVSTVDTGNVIVRAVVFKIDGNIGMIKADDALGLGWIVAIRIDGDCAYVTPVDVKNVSDVNNGKKYRMVN